jgi:hypothetical protein
LSNSGFVWVRSPDDLAQDIEDYGNRVEAALYAAANAWGQHIQDLARENAAWTDRTANARSGLFYAVDGFGHGEMQGDVSAEAKALMTDVEVVSAGKDEIIIVLGHTVFYGKFLELSHGGNYAIIMSTIEENLPALERLIRKAYAA